MSLISINADFARLVSVLSEIRDILDRAFPPAVIPEQNPKKREKESLSVVTAEARYEKEVARKIERAKKEGLPLDG